MFYCGFSIHKMIRAYSEHCVLLETIFFPFLCLFWKHILSIFFYPLDLFSQLEMETIEMEADTCNFLSPFLSHVCHSISASTSPDYNNCCDSQLQHTVPLLYGGKAISRQLN